MFFENRTDAGTQLATRISALGRTWAGWTCVGIARGGVMIGEPIATTLGMPLIALVVEEFITRSGMIIATNWNVGYRADIVGKKTRLTFLPDVLAADVAAEEKDAYGAFLQQLAERATRYNLGLIPQTPERALVCDDGLVSGQTMSVAINVLRALGTKEVAVAVPVVPPWATSDRFGCEVLTWRVTTMKNPTSGIFYFSFPETPDDEVIRAITAANTLVHH